MMTPTAGSQPGRKPDVNEKWPIELWLSVFSIAHPIQLWDPREGLLSLLSVSWVCKRWREAAIAYKQFWSIVVLDWPSELLELYLQRSSDYPLHVFFNSDHGDPDFIDEERRTIQRNFRQVFGDAFNMSRIRRIDLTVLDTSLNVVLDEYISQHEAHNLESFVYNTENYALRRQPVFARAFHGVPPPHLRRLALSGDKIPPHSPILSASLVDLTLDAVDLGDADCIFQVLDSLPSLERLTLRNSLDRLRSADISLGKVAVLSQLQGLEIGYETLGVVNFVRRLRLPRVQDLKISIMHESPVTSLPLIRSSMELAFNAVEDMFTPGTDSAQPSYNELCVRFGVIYSHLEFVLLGGREGLPPSLQFSFHDTDELSDESQSDEDGPKPSVALVRYGLQMLPFLSRLQSLVIGPTVDFTRVSDWVEALRDVPRIQAVPCIGADGATVMLGLVQALRIRPALFTHLRSVSVVNTTGSPMRLSDILARHLALLPPHAGATEGGKERPLELLVEKHQVLDSVVTECLLSAVNATSLRVV